MQHRLSTCNQLLTEVEEKLEELVVLSMDSTDRARLLDTLTLVKEAIYSLSEAQLEISRYPKAKILIA